MNKYFMNDETNNNEINSVNGGNSMMIKDLNEFATVIKDYVEERLGDGYKANINVTLKNNGQKLTGIVISNQTRQVVPNIYLNSFYEDYQNGVAIDDIANKIIDIHMSAHKEFDFAPNDIHLFDKVKSRICLKLINKDANQERLNQVPYKEFNDLAVVFYILVENRNDEIGTVLINNELFNSWNVLIDDLYDTALENTERHFKGIIQPMSSVIAQLISGFEYDDFEMPSIDSFMYVASNVTKINGASVMLYENLLSRFANHINSDFYILPSSIHECILIPITDEINPEELKEMVSTINISEVPAEDILSNSIYKFDREAGSVEIV